VGRLPAGASQLLAGLETAVVEEPGGVWQGASGHCRCRPINPIARGSCRNSVCCGAGQWLPAHLF
jgi:hypothetical protein